MNKLESFYPIVPICLQNILCSSEGLRIQITRFNRKFLDLQQDYEKRTFFTQEDIREYRNLRLRLFIYHAYETVPFYRHLFQDLSLEPEAINTLEDLRYLPILTKSQVKNELKNICSHSIPKKQEVLAHTSGTTGEGLKFTTTHHAIREQWATWWRYRRWHGLEMGTWCGYFGGRSVVPIGQESPPFWRYNYPGRQILFSGYHMNSINLEFYVHELNTQKPKWLHGYPSLLSLLASYLIEQNTTLNYLPQWITIGSENLQSHQFELIYKAFGVRPIQHYGLTEGVANISECPHGKLHVDEDFAAVEFLPNPYGEGYKIIGTNFTNLATPLIRYDTQDLVSIEDDYCPCGRTGRVVTRIDGRQEDYVILKNGSRLGRLDHIFKDMVNVREAQIVQRKHGSICLRVVKGSEYGEFDERSLLTETRKRVGFDTEINIEYCEILERSRNGKLRFVVSNL